ncbi:hypothetical protein HDV04_003453 [Boothiomyces sp. JEL0838]|nr:hypothetical protein HDV04_003453 [Boothiomyces sp. JEL0838]
MDRKESKPISLIQKVFNQTVTTAISSPKELHSGTNTEHWRGSSKRKGGYLEKRSFKFNKAMNEFTEDGVYFLNVDGK